jgi:hypothetical protein
MTAPLSRLQRPARRLARCKPILTEQTGLDMGGQVMPEGRMVLANLVHSGLDRFGDGGAGPLRIGTDLPVPAAEAVRRRQFSAEPVHFRLGLGGTAQVMATFRLGKRGA